ncbi:MAG: hypothetical protein DI626_07755 [Micavibrio aeruginosavorus]|uniref:Nudix hydrolase domain-containing protein n=1 Tax=Micavibrio aeruginosavorus TaxID=349221 RepID=A0A2W4ZRY1_9BACT|nr:MAG: hypothetical protein DI626_07755 [Micavibrio aeruginosavorus]
MGMNNPQNNSNFILENLPVRNVSRVLLIHEDKVLLMKVDLPDRSFWCTIGGGMENNETVEEAVKREAYEEVGLTGQDVTWDRSVWHGEHVLKRHGVDTLHKETFVLGYANSTKIDPAALTEEEKAVVKEFKWWPIHELETTTEFVVPPSMVTHIKPIMNGQIPHSPIQIDLSDSPAKAFDVNF